MFLDDVIIFCHRILQIINSKIKNTNNFIYWKYLRADKSIFPSNVNNLSLGEIASCSYLFHSQYKDKSRWTMKHGGDFDL